MLRGTNNLAGVIGELDLSASVDLYREGLALARKVGRRDFQRQFAGNLGYAAFLAGDWDIAVAELEAVVSPNIEPRDGLLIWNNLLIIRANRGESIADGLVEMERMGKDMSGVQWHLFVKDPEANAALAKGDFAQAAAAFAAVAESDSSQAPEFFYRSARAALWASDLDEARRLTALEAIGGYGPVIAARHATLRAGIAALEGRSADAIALYQAAFSDGARRMPAGTRLLLGWTPQCCSIRWIRRSLRSSLRLGPFSNDSAPSLTSTVSIRRRPLAGHATGTTAAPPGRRHRVNCANCGFENLPGAKFCMDCGAPMSSGCPSCGFVNLPNAKFCMECGTQLGGTAVAASGGPFAGRLLPPWPSRKATRSQSGGWSAWCSPISLASRPTPSSKMPRT